MKLIDVCFLLFMLVMWVIFLFMAGASSEIFLAFWLTLGLVLPTYISLIRNLGRYKALNAKLHQDLIDIEKAKRG